MRPVFHSEADFQHSLAWEIHRQLPHADVRLELPVAHAGKQLHVDLWVSQGINSLALELKYKTRTLTLEHQAERYSLANHSAQDTGRYDFIKDVQRLEQITASRERVTAYAIILTNDSSYWSAPREKTSVDIEFRIHEGRTLQGVLQWQPHASAGTMRGREAALNLVSNYDVLWTDYASVAQRAGGKFRYAAIGVQATQPDTVDMYGTPLLS